MKLSIVIVNYNVKHFLEQCLISVKEALSDLEAEVFVVDNNSVDGSVAMVKERFPDVKLIASKENLGFSKGNNLAMKQATGQYILLLNPDTVVEKDTLRSCVEFMDQTKDAGGLGIKMVDGKGNFLPESKRSLPTPAVAFYKIFGFSKLFPKSKKFGKYHLTYLDKDSTHQIDVLSGAFMMLRKSVLDQIGLLDETFFMYGEDIDLSYRITKAGFKNYYFPKARIIHYKGESTKKSSVNYVLVFYKAMVIFANKHFSQKNARSFSTLISIAIYLRAAMSITKRFIQKITLPAFDAIILYAGLYGIKYLWENYVKWEEGLTYPKEFVYIVLPLYVIIWLLASYFQGAYDRPFRTSKVFKGVFTGSAIILVLYALIDEEYRFSRAIILAGAVWAVITMLFVRISSTLLKYKSLNFGKPKKKRIAIVANRDEFNRVVEIISKSQLDPDLLGRVSINSENSSESDNNLLGNFSQLSDITDIYSITEIIFCSQDIEAREIIDMMSHVSRPDIEYKIAPPESIYIIGSNSINTSGELYVIDINSIDKPENRRTKRVLDICYSLAFLVCLPILVFIVKQPIKLILNIFLVIIGSKTWVGYCDSDNINELPQLKPSVLNPTDTIRKGTIDTKVRSNLNLLYAKDYNSSADFQIVIKSLKLLGK